MVPVLVMPPLIVAVDLIEIPKPELALAVANVVAAVTALVSVLNPRIVPALVIEPATVAPLAITAVPVVDTVPDTVTFRLSPAPNVQTSTLESTMIRLATASGQATACTALAAIPAQIMVTAWASGLSVRTCLRDFFLGIVVLT